MWEITPTSQVYYTYAKLVKLMEVGLSAPTTLIYVDISMIKDYNIAWHWLVSDIKHHKQCTLI
jgi:hypothetical protein